MRHCAQSHGRKVRGGMVPSYHMIDTLIQVFLWPVMPAVGPGQCRVELELQDKLQHG